MPKFPLAIYKRRDALLIRMRLEGYSTSYLSQHFKITPRRVTEILRMNGHRTYKQRHKKREPEQILLDLGFDGPESVSESFKRAVASSY